MKKNSMKKINLNFLFPLCALVLLIFALSQPMFNTFSFGKVLDPFIGAVQSGSEREPASSRLALGGLGCKDSVDIYFDKRMVPHIYAKDEEDLYFAQGYVTAYLRLWQMDFLTYASAGRLSEIFRDGFLDYDRNQRRLGILESARTALKMIEADPESRSALSAYTRGVNAYIRHLDYRKMPFEYKFLDYTPEPWSDLKTVLTMKYIGNTLSGYEDDFAMSHLMLALGEDKFNLLFPEFSNHVSPVADTTEPGWKSAFGPIRRPAYLDYSFLSSGSVIAESPYNPKLGSNSWAVSGKKTRCGSPILSSDPHLNLTLPSIWLEMQLSAPGMNVYGVTIPGTPAVIIGFNNDIAWGITNGADDVKDWYKLKITPDYKKYELDGKWVDMSYSIEEIKRKGQKAFYDTVYHTVFGPVVFDKSFPGAAREKMYYAMKWELNNPSNEILAFLKLNRAQNYKDYREAIKHYSCPIQNFTFACKDNTIAITHQGKMAVKTPGQGLFVMDGTNSSTLNERYIPEDSLPQLLNPSCGYVLSANQHPTNKSYPYYYNGYFSDSRADMIKGILQGENDFDIGKMEAMQLNNVNSFAMLSMPVLLKIMDRYSLPEDQKKAISDLAAWRGEYGYSDTTAKLFDLWMDDITDYTWDEFKDFDFSASQPSGYTLLDLIQNQPNNDFFDREGTTKKETAYDIVAEAFTAAFTEYEKLKKEGTVEWSNFRRVNIMHLTNIPAFSNMNIPSAGYPAAINAMSYNWGPSWRMVVELGDRPKAYGIYPGGQSGNIGSKFYDDFIGDWNKGNYYPLEFFQSGKEAGQHAIGKWSLK